jgi:hypothetical protein
MSLCFLSNIAVVRTRKERAMVRRIALPWVLAILAATSASAQIPISRDLVPKRSAMARLGLEQNWMSLVPIVGAERLSSISLA